MSQVDSNDSEQSTFQKFYSNCFRKKTSAKISEPVPIITLIISNESTRYRLVHGSQYLSMLQPRDQVLEHDFNFRFQFPLQRQSNGEIMFTRSVYYQDIVKHIKSFLVEASSNVVSVSFKYLNEGKLQEKQSKEYAAKNIMLNVQSILSHTIKAFESNEKLIKRINIEEVKEDLAIEIDCILKNIMINLADSYPQAPASGATPKMKDVINDVNRADDEENDLIYANNINIREFVQYETKNSKADLTTYEKICFNEDGYTEFIMKVINTAIEVTMKNKQDYRERTMRQIFTEFNEKLFWLSQQKKYQPIINSLDQKKVKLKEDKDESISLDGVEEKESTKAKIIDYFNLTLERNGKKYKSLNERYENEDFTKKQHMIRINGKKSKIYNEGSLSNFVDLISETEEGIEAMKKNKTYAIGQKIPTFVKMFSKQDIINKVVTAKHESILRILTKWAEYLQDIFQNPEIHIRRRLYPFKNFNNEILRSFQGKQQLILRLAKEYKEVKKKFKAILKSNFGYIGTYLCKEEDSFVSSVSRYSQTRTASSKINTILTFLMVSYTCQLIHHLLKAGHHLDNGNGGFQDVNLVVFRVSDLMRSKLQCSQSSFINLLKTVYLLDNSPQMAGKFKLVRIKNKLDDPANNIIINYLFMGKVQCELQLSTQQPKGKAMHNYMFSHFIYELTRGKFGTITECAIMISQLDPMITACKDNSYSEKLQGRMIQRQSAKEDPLQEEQKVVRMFNEGRQDMNSARAFMVEQVIRQTIHPTKTIDEQIKQAIFQCLLCSRLIIKQNRHIFQTENHSKAKVCNNCLGKSLQAQTLLENKMMMKALVSQLRRGQIKRIYHYRQLQYLYKHQCVLSISQNGLLNFSVILYIESELKHFLVKIDERVLDAIDVPNFDFNSINYIDITQQVIKNFRKGKKFTKMIYLIRKNFSFGPEMYDVMDIREKLLRTQLDTVIKLFKQFREEKQIIKNIKFKAEIINANNKKDHWRLLDKIGTLLALRESGLEPVGDPLKYNKVQELDFTNIKTIEASDLNLRSLPKWLKKIYNLKSLNFRNNSLEQICNDDIPEHVCELSLENNRLKKFKLTNHQNLTKLDLRSNDLTVLDLSPLNTLTHLLLSNNPLGRIDLANLPNLVELHLENNNLKSVDLKNLKDLARLQLKNNQIELLDLKDNENLTELNLSMNNFKNITLSNLKNLVKIDLNSNPICELVLTDLKKLLKIELSNTPLVKAILTNLASLTILDLKNNKLEIVQLKNINALATLELNNNPLYSLSLENLIVIKKIQIEGTKLTNLKMQNLPKLAELRLRKNQLKAISLRNLSNLSLLDLGQNNFANFSLDHLSKLTTLLLDNNKLEKINLGYETDLIYLDIRWNKLQKISLYNPNQLKMVKKVSLKFDYSGGLGKVKLLFISGNPGLKFDTFPPSLQFLEANVEAVRDFDCQHLTNLKELKVKGGKIQRGDIKNLRENAKFESKEGFD